MINRKIRPNAAPASSGLGSSVQGAHVAETSGRGLVATKSWTPTVANLLVLIVLEVLAFGGLRYVINRIV